MNEFLRHLFAERIGGERFGLDDTVYKFEKIKRAKRAAMTAHPDIELIDMGVGEPDDMAFPEVVQTLAEEAAKWENRTYADTGIDAFREAAAVYMQELYGVKLNPQTQVCHSIGSKPALAMLPACFIDPGDITIMTTPGYPVLGTWTRYFGGEVVQLPLTRDNGFFPDLEPLTPDQRRRAKLLYLNYPNNPTGASASEEQYRRAVDFARENQILLVSDAAYAALNFAGQPLSILSIPSAMDCAVELHSMSKGFNMTGWRLGWVCGNPLAVSAYISVKDNSDSGQFAAIQRAAIRALENQAAITPVICAKYERRLAAMTEILQQAGFPATMPAGSFFLYVESPKGTRQGDTFASAEDFSQWLIREKLISTVPWDDAGAFVRLSATFVAPGEDEEKRVLAELRRRLADVQLLF